MKNLKLFLVAGLLTVSAPAFAQFANTGNNNAGNSASATVSTGNYNRISLSYNPLTIAPDKDNTDNATFTGISLAYTKGFSLSKNYPVFIEAGVKLNYYFKNDDMEWSNFFDEDAKSDDEIETEFTGVSASIPVNLAYKFAIPNSDISITPFIGVNFKYNIIAKYKTKYSEESEEDSEYDDYYDYYDDVTGTETENSNDKEVDLFDKEEAGGKDSQWKRFQLGWNIGVGVDYKALYLGLSYGSDFTELAKKTKTNNWAISVGYNF